MLENLPVCLKVVENQKEVALVAQTKGKAKGKGKSFRYPLRPSYLSLEDRRKKLAKLKAESACRDCGKKGHWSGDPQCNHKKKKNQTHMKAVLEVENETKRSRAIKARMKKKKLLKPKKKIETKKKESDPDLTAFAKRRAVKGAVNKDR